MKTKKQRSKHIPEHQTIVGLGQAGQSCFEGMLSVIIWNVFRGRKTGWLKDIAHLADEEAQLILLQEAVFKKAGSAFFKHSKHFEWVMAQSYRFSGHKNTTGVKTGSLVQASDVIYYKSPDKEPVANTPKMILATKYPLSRSDKSLLTLNIHAINFVSIRKFERQLKQLLQTVESHKGPVILGGDFNTWNKSREDVLARLIESLKLKQVDFNHRPKVKHLNRVLDHVFYRGLKLSSSYVLHEFKSSDHCPLKVDFEIL